MTELQLLTGSIADLKWFQEHSKELVKSYEGKFIAIKSKSVVDSDINAVLLLKKLENQGEDSNLILIKHVTPKNEIVIL